MYELHHVLLAGTAGFMLALFFLVILSFFGDHFE